MSAEKETLTRVQQGLYHLTRGLAPFVEGRMRKVHGERWLTYASRAQGSMPNAALDAYGLLKTIIDNWREVFDEAFGRSEKQKVRNFASTALEARNATSHLTIPLQDDEALRYLDAIHHLLRFTKAPPSEVSELKRLYDEQRKTGVQTAAQPPAEPGLNLTAPPTPAETARGLKPWIEVALPHPDVLANRFKEAEFAADLFAVDHGLATDDYGKPEDFFRITFLTEGLKRVVVSVLQRLAGIGGDPVIGLQTAFGGGKTHTMLAAYHLAKATDLNLLEGVRDLAKQAGITDWKPAKTAVFVGSSKGADVSLTLDRGPRIHTLWGYIAWRLAGDDGLSLMAEAEAARSSPGSELMVKLLKMAGPSIILLDELVLFARQLPDDRFETFLSFIQSLTEAVKLVPGAVLVGSLPESRAEAGGQKGVDALLRMEKIFGRTQSAWLPASGDEPYEIIRRRLFQRLDADGEKAREETVKAFHDLYRKNGTEFPPEAAETRYANLLRTAYPIHPELFDRLSKDWSTLPNFQRTRGVLRFMANVVGVLWHQQDRSALITPARIPIAHDRVRTSVLYPLNPAFAAVVDKEVDGEGALPTRMEANPQRRMSQMRAATRAARAVFLCSAPLVGQPNAGLNGQGLRLACAEPGDQLSAFGDALRELKERATYLYEEGGRYWFSTAPTLNRLAEDRAKAYPEHEVDDEIGKVLTADAGTKGGFARVFAVPDDPSTIDEASALSLVILNPSMAHAGKTAGKSAATDAVSETLLRCRASQREFRNTLLFVAADEGLLATARETMRKAMAWKSIAEDGRLKQQMTTAQIEDAEKKAKSGRDGAQTAIRMAWNHVIYPNKTEETPPGSAFHLERLAVSAKDRTAVPVVVYDKAKADGIARERLGSETFSKELQRLWPDDRAHLAVSEIAKWYGTYLYLPKLRDEVVLKTVIRDAVGNMAPAFGYAERFDPASGKYDGLIWAKAPPDPMAATAVLVKAEVVHEHQRPVIVKPIEPPTEGGATFDGGPDRGGGPVVGPGGGPAPTPTPGPTKTRKQRRFYGSVEIDMVRPVKSFEKILNEVVQHLQETPRAKVKLTIEIEAEAPDGFDDTDVGVIRDNTRDLKFKVGGFDE